MNMKNVSLFALVFIANLVNANTPEKIFNNVKKEWQKADRDYNEAIYRDHEKYDELLETPKGKHYKNKSDAWLNCVRSNGVCSAEEKSLEFACLELKETEEYQKGYRLDQQELCFLYYKASGLRRILDFVNFRSREFGSGIEAMDNAVDSIKIPTNSDESSLLIEWAENSVIQQELVKKDLYKLVQEQRSN